MKGKTKARIALGAGVFFAAVFLSVMAGVTDAAEQKLTVTDGFARYQFNSVTATINSPASEYGAGSEIPFAVTLHNTNTYPIVDGNVYVKIYKKQGDQMKEDVDFFAQAVDEVSARQGDLLTDQFMALENISLNALETKTLDFSYSLPLNLSSGQYQIVTFFQSAKRFNLLGLPFTEDIFGNSFSFTVKNQDIVGGVEFDKNDVQLNGEPYEFIGFLTSYGEGDDIKVEAPIKNTTGENQAVTIIWNLYYWDQLLEQNKLSADQEIVTLKPNETKVLTHTVKGNSYPVNFLEVRAVWEDSSSILDIRFSRDTKEKARFNFAGLSNFPLKAEEETVVFATAHAVKNFAPAIEPGTEKDQRPNGSQENYTLTLTVKDRDKKVLGSYSYQGTIEGSVTGYEAPLKLDRSYDYAALEVNLKDSQGNIVDETTLTYDCQALGTSECQAAKANVENSQSSIGQTVKNPAVALVIIITIIAIIIIIVWKRRGVNISLFILFAIAAGFSMASSVQAGVIYEDKSGNSDIEGVAGRQKVWSGWLGDRAYKSQNYYDYYAWATIDEINSSVTYSAESSRPDGETLQEGNVFYITDKTASDPKSIDWNVTGYNSDSPPGCWRSDLMTDYEKLGNSCKYQVYKENGSAGIFALNAAVTFKEPGIRLSTKQTTGGDSPVNCVPAGRRGWKCTVTGSGVVRACLTYGATKGAFLYESSCNMTSTKQRGEFLEYLKCQRPRQQCGRYDSSQGFLSIVTKNDTCSKVKYESDVCMLRDWCQECGSDNSLNLPETTFCWNYRSVPEEIVRINLKNEKDNTLIRPTETNLTTKFQLGVDPGVTFISEVFRTTGISTTAKEILVSGEEPILVKAGDFPNLSGWDSTGRAVINCTTSTGANNGDKLKNGGTCVIDLFYNRETVLFSLRDVTNNVNILTGYPANTTLDFTVGTKTFTSGPIKANGVSRNEGLYVDDASQSIKVTGIAPAIAGYTRVPAQDSYCGAKGASGILSDGAICQARLAYSRSNPENYTLTVNKVGSGAGSGRVSSVSHPALNCNNGCYTSSESNLPSATTINDVTASVNGTTIFNNWSGCDSTSGPGNSVCHVNNMNSNRTIVAAFQSSACTPSCGDADEHCAGEYWSNGCPPANTDCGPGTKDCSSSPWKETMP